ncbi:hypothetical protein BKA66DRAFT_436454 [Pyrenochaeta sp. MPI-SDFR-AT-0127]|nr:hypothetical protein BKA66DRAFT_436454 [Pyrenochaeta sp. MPI-SDFR-AT-0127]
MSGSASDKPYAPLLVHFRKTASGEVDESQVKDFYEFIISQEHGETILDSILHQEGTFAHKVALNAEAKDEFKTSTSAEAGLLNLWFYTQLDLKAKNISRRFQGSAWGVSPGLPVGALFGTLWYNDVSELKGKCSFFVGSFTQYVYANFWNGDKHIATFHGGHVGSAIGGSWGSGEWKEQ